MYKLTIFAALAAVTVGMIPHRAIPVRTTPMKTRSSHQDANWHDPLYAYGYYVHDPNQDRLDYGLNEFRINDFTKNAWSTLLPGHSGMYFYNVIDSYYRGGGGHGGHGGHANRFGNREEDIEDLIPTTVDINEHEHRVKESDGRKNMNMNKHMGNKYNAHKTENIPTDIDFGEHEDRVNENKPDLSRAMMHLKNVAPIRYTHSNPMVRVRNLPAHEIPSTNLNKMRMFKANGGPYSEGYLY